MTAPGQRRLGFWAVLALVVGNMIGSGIYLMPASLAQYGWNQLLGWLVTLCGATALAVVFARLAGRLPHSGGPYVYANAAFGPLAGFVAAWSYWLLNWLGNGAIAVAVVSNLSLIFPAIGAMQGLPAVLAVAIIWLLTLVNVLGVRWAGQVQKVTTALKLLPLLALAALSLWLALRGAGSAHNAGPPLSGHLIATSAAITFFAFTGLEAATIPAGKIENAAITVPRATIAGVALTGLIYFAVSLAFAFYLPFGVAQASPAPVATFLGRYFGAGIEPVIALFAAISAFGALNGFILVQGETPWAMARGGVFPAWLGAESRFGTPLRGHVVSSALLSVVTLLNYQKGMSDLFNSIITICLAPGLLAYLLSALAALRLAPEDRVLVLAALVAAAFVIWAEVGLGTQALVIGAALTLAGLPVYAWVRSAAASAARVDRPE